MAKMTTRKKRGNKKKVNRTLATGRNKKSRGGRGRGRTAMKTRK